MGSATFLLVKDFRAMIIVQILGGYFMVCGLIKDYDEETRSLLQVTIVGFFADNCNNIMSGVVFPLWSVVVV